MQKIVYIILIFSIYVLVSCTPSSTASTEGPLIQQIQSSVDNLQTDLDQLHSKMQYTKSELELVDDKLESQEKAIDHLSLQMKDFTTSQIKLQQVKLADLEKQVASLYKNCEGIAKDLKQFKSHFESSNVIFKQFSERLQQLEAQSTDRDQKLELLRSNIDSVVRLLQEDGSTSKTTHTTNLDKKKYTVKLGDSLEKIAKANGVTIEQLKQANQLGSDKIVAGQKLTIPTT
ncbi:MAG: hypothetical protein K0S74_285 [Chlamydiales bacterium]|jgi:LysM repeat protein|nr:hypothetical protein [Chlamydiales bacterium]